MKYLLALSLLFVTNQVVAQQQMYQWKDTNGQVHFSDNPAMAAKASNAKLLDTPSAQKVNSTTAISEEQIEARRTQDAELQQQNIQQQAHLERLQDSCRKEYATLQLIKTKKRIKVPDPDPTNKTHSRFLSDEELDAYIAKVENDYNNSCSRL